MVKYFVSYTFKNGPFGYGFGHIEIHYEKDIHTMKDINIICRSIEDNHPLERNSVVILNYIKLE